MSDKLHNLPLIIEPQQLADHLQDARLLIVDLSSEEHYHHAHLPGAVHVSPRALVAGNPPAPGQLPPVETLEQLFGALGLQESTHVVVYDDEGGGWAGRFIWTLDVIGHQHYSYLNGGLAEWLAQGHASESQPRRVTPTQVTIQLQSAPIADREYLMSRLGASDLAIWDARSPAEYRGEKKLAERAGHIPGAVNYEWTRGMDKNRHRRLRDLETIRAELADLGITEQQEVITHCQTHHRSGFTYLLGKALGFRHIKAYPGSWSEWGNDPNTPVESQT